MNIQLKDVDKVKFNGIDISAVKFNDVLVWQKWETIEYTGGVPVTITANGEPLLDYLISGNMQQSGTPSPSSIIMPQETGEKTANLFDKYGEKTSPSNTTYNYTLTGLTPNAPYTCSTNFVGDKTKAASVYFAGGNTGTNGVWSDAPKTFNANADGEIIVYVRRITVTDSNPAIYDDLMTGAIWIMVNEGSTPQPFEPFGYKLPFSSGGENLFDKDDATTYDCYVTSNGQWATGAGNKTVRISCDSNTQYTLSTASTYTAFRIMETNSDNIPSDGSPVSGTLIYYGSGNTYTFTTSNTAKYIIFQANAASLSQWLSELMLNLGSTAKPYTPYNRTTTPIYLGEVETTRRIKKLEFDGTEDWTQSSTDVSYNRYKISISDMKAYGTRLTPLYCTHYQSVSDGRAVSNVPNNSIYTGSGIDTYIKDTTFSSIIELKTFLQQEYANGTPVTVWYVLANEQTGILNEPIRKIGDYADSISMEQAQVQIPTVSGVNVVDINTTLKPSAIYLKYKGKS